MTKFHELSEQPSYVGLDAIMVMWDGTFEQIFIPTSHEGSIWNLASNGLMFFEEKKF